MITTVTDESVLAQCDDLFVDLKNQCDFLALVMEQCSDPAYDKYIEDRGLSNRIEPEQLDQGSGPFGAVEEPEMEMETEELTTEDQED